MPPKNPASAKFDFKKVYKDCYAPKPTPLRLFVPILPFISAQRAGNPNEPNGTYQAALKTLFTLSYTLKMSKTTKALKDYVEYVVPPLESLWWGNEDLSNKANFKWQAMIAQPDFITQELFEWACEEVQSKKGIDCSNARLLRFEEGLCVQILHIGSYDEEPQSLAKIEEFITRNGLQNDIGKDNLTRAHHEIYLSNLHKTPTHKLKTILRIPVRDG
ncbi:MULTISPECIES: GyrI-like domain-containing protein [Helicobacter]|uniref:GyrI-like domain-containing protein n=1 Tax=Helicobacter TaxID=209 RepID=UPI002FE1988E